MAWEHHLLRFGPRWRHEPVRLRTGFEAHRKLTNYTEWDVRNPSLGPGEIVYENGGGLYALDLKSRAIREIPVAVPGVAAAPEGGAQWRQALEDVWRAYAENAFRPAAGWEGVKTRYAELMKWAAHRSDAEYVLSEMLGEAGQSHIALVWAGARERAEDTGLLGADFRVESGRYRIARIYDGGPLAAPGLNVREGDFILAVNGKPVRGSEDICAALVGLAGKQAAVTVSSSGTAADAHDVAVSPLASERGVRYAGWVRANRTRVAEATSGRIGYIHIFNVDDDGIEAFRKEWRGLRNRVAGVILDIRNNGGGSRPEEVLAWIGENPMRLMYDRRGRVPPFGNFLDGPKVMIANDQAVSGGDELAYFFKQRTMGRLVGTRTMGGMIGSGAPHKIAGGWILFVPELAFYAPGAGAWYPENYGVEPDVAAELKPYALSGGRDPQLEKAIEEAMAALKTYKKIPEPPL